jgi:hypothetical protein
MSIRRLTESALRNAAPLALITALSVGCSDSQTDGADVETPDITASVTPQDVDVANSLGCLLNAFPPVAVVSAVGSLISGKARLGFKACGKTFWEASIASMRAAGFPLVAKYFEHSLQDAPSPVNDDPDLIAALQAHPEQFEKVLDFCIAEVKSGPVGTYKDHNEPGTNGQGDLDINIQPSALELFVVLGHANASCRATRTALTAGPDDPRGDYHVDIWIRDVFQFEWDWLPVEIGGAVATSPAAAGVAAGTGVLFDKKLWGLAAEDFVHLSQIVGLMHKFPNNAHIAFDKKGWVPAPP